MIFPPNPVTTSANVILCDPETPYERPSSGVRLSLAAGVVDPNHRSSIPPRFNPNAYKSLGSSFSLFPGCKNDRGTQQGTSRSNPPPCSIAASAALFTFEDTVCNSFTD